MGKSIGAASTHSVPPPSVPAPARVPVPVPACEMQVALARMLHESVGPRIAIGRIKISLDYEQRL